MNGPNFLSTSDETAKNHALIAYILMGIGLFTGVFWLIGAIWAFVKKSDAQNSVFLDHYENMIALFWWSLGLTILGLIFIFVVIGYFILFGVWVWSVYRLIKGLLRLSSNRPYH